MLGKVGHNLALAKKGVGQNFIRRKGHGAKVVLSVEVQDSVGGQKRRSSSSSHLWFNYPSISLLSIYFFGPIGGTSQSSILFFFFLADRGRPARLALMIFGGGGRPIGTHLLPQLQGWPPPPPPAADSVWSTKEHKMDAFSRLSR